MVTLVIATRNAHKVGEIRAILGDGFHCLSLNEFPDAPEVVEDAGSFAGNATKKALALAQWLGRGGGLKSEIRSPSGSGAGVSPVLLVGPGPVTGETPAPLLSEVRNPKSEGASDRTFVLADDSGLEVDALHGVPGVHSARFAALDTGKPGNSPTAENNAKLLRLLGELLLERRTARFRCVLALTPVAGSVVEGASPVCYADKAELETELFEGACEGRIGFAPRGRGGFGYDPLFVPSGYEQTFGELSEEVKNRLSHRAKALAKLRRWLVSKG